MPVTHQFVSQKPDGSDDTLVRPSDWNAGHTVLVDLDSAEVTGVLPSSHGGVGALFNVAEYGAIGDGVTDDTDAINDAFDALRTWRLTNGGRGARVFFPDGVYSVSSINATLIISNWFIIGAGATLLANTDDVAVLDMLGSYGCGVFGITIRTPSGVVPRVGIQQARQSGGGALDYRFWKCDIDGTFSLAPLINIGGEVTTYEHCHFINRQSGSDKYGLVLDGWNYWGAESLYLTPTLTRNSPVGMTKITTDNCTIGAGGSSAVTHPAVWMSYVRNARLHGYLATWDSTAFEIYAASNTHGIQDVIFDCRCEAQVSAVAGIQQIFKFIGSATAPIHQDCAFRENALFALSSVFLADTGITPVLNNWNIHITGLASASRPPANGMFYPRGQFSEPSGDIYWGDRAVPLDITGTTFRGTIRVYNRGTASYPIGSQNIYDDLNDTLAVKGETRWYGSTTTSVASGTLTTLDFVRLRPAGLTFNPISSSPTNPGVLWVDPLTAANGGYVSFNQSDQGLHFASDAEGFIVRKSGSCQVLNGLLLKTRVVTASGDVTVNINTDYAIIVNKSSGAATNVNLPSGITHQAFVIKDGKGDASSNNITIVPAAGNIDGASSYVMASNYESTTVIYNGTQWNVI